MSLVGLLQASSCSGEVSDEEGRKVAHPTRPAAALSAYPFEQCCTCMTKNCQTLLSQRPQMTAVEYCARQLYAPGAWNLGNWREGGGVGFPYFGLERYVGGTFEGYLKRLPPPPCPNIPERLRKVFNLLVLVDTSIPFEEFCVSFGFTYLRLKEFVDTLPAPSERYWIYAHGGAIYRGAMPGSCFDFFVNDKAGSETGLTLREAMCMVIQYGIPMYWCQTERRYRYRFVDAPCTFHSMLPDRIASVGWVKKGGRIARPHVGVAPLFGRCGSCGTATKWKESI